MAPPGDARDTSLSNAECTAQGWLDALRRMPLPDPLVAQLRAHAAAPGCWLPDAATRESAAPLAQALAAALEVAVPEPPWALLADPRDGGWALKPALAVAIGLLRIPEWAADRGGKPPAALHPPPGESPIVVLVRPQLADNIGACARAMANGGLFHLRLVAPRDGWPQDRAWRAASGADRILDAAVAYPDVPAAIADCVRVFATCPRPRHAVIPLLTARAAAADLRACGAANQRSAVLFGPERAGLENDDVARADTLVRYPLNPAHASLNLGQAVMVLAYEWWLAADATPARQLPTGGSRPAVKAELDGFLDRLVGELDQTGFFTPPEKKPGMVRNLRHLFQRGTPTDQEVRTLHGVVSELLAGRRG